MERRRPDVRCFFLFETSLLCRIGSSVLVTVTCTNKHIHTQEQYLFFLVRSPALNVKAGEELLQTSPEYNR